MGNIFLFFYVAKKPHKYQKLPKLEVWCFKTWTNKVCRRRKVGKVRKHFSLKASEMMETSYFTWIFIFGIQPISQNSFEFIF